MANGDKLAAYQKSRQAGAKAFVDKSVAGSASKTAAGVGLLDKAKLDWLKNRSALPIPADKVIQSINDVNSFPIVNKLPVGYSENYNWSNEIIGSQSNDPAGAGFNSRHAMRFVSDWLNRRRDVLADNAGVKSGDSEYSRQVKNMAYSPVYNDMDKLLMDYQRNQVNPFYKKDPETHAQRAHFRDEINSTLNSPIKGVNLSLSDDKGDYKSIYINPDEKGQQSTLVHEYTHSMLPKPQENKISEIMADSGRGSPKSDIDRYLDSPDEVYARLMELRYNMGLDPQKKYTLDDIKKIRDRDGGKDMIFLNRYDNKTILRLLNEVASVNKIDRNTKNA